MIKLTEVKNSMNSFCVINYYRIDIELIIELVKLG